MIVNFPFASFFAGLRYPKAGKVTPVTGVTVKSPGPIGHGTTVTDNSTGAEILGIRHISLEIAPDDLTFIVAEIFTAEIEVSGALQLVAADPNTGSTKTVTRIEFDDGTFWVQQ